MSVRLCLSMCVMVCAMMGCRTPSSVKNEVAKILPESVDPAIQALLDRHAVEDPGFEVSAHELAVDLDGKVTFLAVVVECARLWDCRASRDTSRHIDSLVWLYRRKGGDAAFDPMEMELPLELGADPEFMYVPDEGHSDSGLLWTESTETAACVIFAEEFEEEILWQSSSRCGRYRPAPRRPVTLRIKETSVLSLHGQVESFDMIAYESGEIVWDRWGGHVIPFFSSRVRLLSTHNAYHFGKINELTIWSRAPVIEDMDVSRARDVLDCESFLERYGLPPEDDVMAWAHVISAFGTEPLEDEARCAIHDRNARYLEDHLDTLIAEYDRRRAEVDVWTSLHWEEMPVELLDPRLRDILDRHYREILRIEEDAPADSSLAKIHWPEHFPYLFDLEVELDREQTRRATRATTELAVLLRAIHKSETRPKRLISWAHGHIQRGTAYEEIGALFAMLIGTQRGDDVERRSWSIMRDALLTVERAWRSGTRVKQMVAPTAWRSPRPIDEVQRAYFLVNMARPVMIGAAIREGLLDEMITHLRAHPDRLSEIAQSSIYPFLAPVLAHEAMREDDALRHAYVETQFAQDYEDLCGNLSMNSVLPEVMKLRVDVARRHVGQVLAHPGSLQNLRSLVMLVGKSCDEGPESGTPDVLLTERELLDAVYAWLLAHPEDLDEAELLGALSTIIAHELAAHPERDERWEDWMVWMMRSRAWAYSWDATPICRAMEGDEKLLMKWLDVMTSLGSSMDGIWLLLYHMREEDCTEGLSPMAQARFDTLFQSELDDEVDRLQQRLASVTQEHEYNYVRELFVAMPDDRDAEIGAALMRIIEDREMWPSRCELFVKLGTAYRSGSQERIVDGLEERCEE